MKHIDEIIEFLNVKKQVIEGMTLSKENVQAIIDFGLDIIERFRAIGDSPGNNFYVSIDLFRALLDEEFGSDDAKFFKESKEDLLMDISLLISRLERKSRQSS